MHLSLAVHVCVLNACVTINQPLLAGAVCSRVKSCFLKMAWCAHIYLQTPSRLNVKHSTAQVERVIRELQFVGYREMQQRKTNCLCAAAK